MFNKEAVELLIKIRDEISEMDVSRQPIAFAWGIDQALTKLNKYILKYEMMPNDFIKEENKSVQN